MQRGSHSVTFLTILVVSILITCAAHRNLCDFINLTIFFFLIRISNSSFVFILHVLSLSNVGPYIFLSTLLSKTSKRFYSVTVIAHVSQPYVTVGRMIDLYICSLLAALGSLLFRSFLFANKLIFPACILSLISSCIEFLLFICDPKYINWFTASYDLPSTSISCFIMFVFLVNCMYLVLFVFIIRPSFSASFCSVIKVSFSAFSVLAIMTT